MKCKVSGEKILPFMSLGKMPMANGFLDEKDFDKEFFYNLEVGFSKDNCLFQVNEHPKSPKIFNNKYPFYTSKSQYMIKHFKNYFNWAKKNYISNSSKVIEIGSNDGTFLENFKNYGLNHCGFEPSENVAKLSEKKGINVIADFFNLDNATKLKNFNLQTDFICAANVISHIPDLNNLINTIDSLLSKNGVFVFEEPYLGSMLEKISYDQIYDAHIFMFSLLSVRSIFKKYGFDLIDALPQITHGGSMRYVVAREKTRSINVNVKKLINKELTMNMNKIDSCLKFKEQCELSKKKFKKELENLKSEGKSICGYAAAAKSTTVLNYCNINKDIIDYIADSTEEKVGKFSPGKHIPIVSINEFRKRNPDVAVLFSWNHKKEIFEKEKNFSKNGGKWLTHVNI